MDEKPNARPQGWKRATPAQAIIQMEADEEYVVTGSASFSPRRGDRSHPIFRLESELEAEGGGTGPKPTEGSEQQVRLELVLHFAPELAPTEVWQQINRFLQAATLAAPDLNPAYDAFNSHAKNGDIVIALTLAEELPTPRLDHLTATLRALGGEGVEVLLVRVAA